MNPTLLALTGVIAWTLFLLTVMELIRTWLVLTKEVPANGFTADNANLSPFMQRPARAHANCLTKAKAATQDIFMAATRAEAVMAFGKFVLSFQRMRAIFFPLRYRKLLELLRCRFERRIDRRCPTVNRLLWQLNKRLSAYRVLLLSFIHNEL